MKKNFKRNIRNTRSRDRNIATPRRVIALVTASIFGLAACSSGGNAGADGASTSQVTMGNLYGFSSFNPVTTPPPGIDYLQPVYDNLIVRKGINDFSPGLATEWNYDGSTNELDLTLREGVKFTDGEIFDAEAVKANFEYGQSVASGSWADTYTSIDDIEVISPTEMTISFEEPQPAVIEAMASAPGMMVSPEALKSPEQLETAPVGTGPWILDEAETVQNATYSFKKNPDYWDPSVQQVDNVVIKPLVETTTLVNALKSGQVDLIGVTGGEAKSLEREGYKVGSMGSAVEVINIADSEGEVVPALGDVRVRQAIGYALNRDQILEATFGGKGSSSVNPIEEGGLGHSSELENSYEYNVEKAKELMADAGYSDGIDVPVYITAAHSQIGEAISEQLNAIGVRLQLNVVENSGALDDKLNKQESPVTLNALGIRSAWEFYTAFASPEGRYNPFARGTDGLNSLAEEARQFSAEDFNEAEPLYASMFEQLIYEDALIIPVFRQELPVVMREGIEAELETYAGTIPNPRNLSVTE